MELDLLWRNNVAIGGFSAGNSWASTEFGNSGAWGQDFADGDQLHDSKNYHIDTRCVRRD